MKNGNRGLRRLKKKKTEISHSRQTEITLVAALAAYPDFTRSVQWEFSRCPRCTDHVFAVRVHNNPHPLLFFCKRCHWFKLCCESDPAIKRFMADETYANEQKRHPPGPLDREIRKHVQSIRTETHMPPPAKTKK